MVRLTTLSLREYQILSSTLFDDITMARAQENDLVRLVNYRKNTFKQAKKRLLDIYVSLTDQYTQRNDLLNYIAINDDTRSTVGPLNIIKICESCPNITMH